MDSAGQAGKSYQSAGLPVYTADSDSNTGAGTLEAPRFQTPANGAEL